MAEGAARPTGKWNRLDRAAFGLVHGTITVPSLLTAMGDRPEIPFETASILFGSILAVTLAKAGGRMTRAHWAARRSRL